MSDAVSDALPTSKHLRMLTRYKAWANEIIFSMVASLPYEEAIRPRQTPFGNMVHTLKHVYVIDAVFQAHMLGREHSYTARNTPDHPPLDELRNAVRILDAWYVDFSAALTADELERTVHFEFIGGGHGAMTCQEMIFHVVNHGSYHRGFVSDMLYQAGITPKATDLTVFIRDVVRTH